MKKEQLVVARVADKIRKYEKTGELCYTNFLDPSEIIEVESMLSKVPNYLFGGFSEAERKIIIVGCDDEEVAKEYLEILGIESDEKLVHRSVLGSILGLGVSREVIGDILIRENKANVFVTKDILKYLLQNLDRIGKSKVKVYKETYENLLEPENTKKEMTISVASLRLDAVISVTLGLGREVASKIIQNQKVKLNYKLVENVSKQIKLGDVVSVRGYGRIEIMDIVGETRKGRIRIKVSRSI